MEKRKTKTLVTMKVHQLKTLPKVAICSHGNDTYLVFKEGENMYVFKHLTWKNVYIQPFFDETKQESFIKLCRKLENLD